MNRVVYKYKIKMGEFSLRLPIGSEIIKVATQDGSPMMWVNQPTTERDKEHRRFQVVGTGQPFDGHVLVHRGTWFSSVYVWHLFENVG